jgi:glycosyltransferase involved in cell wall biosynthesis
VKSSAPLRILGATAYPLTAASARVRVAQFSPFLRSCGIELSFRPALAPADYSQLASSAPTYRKAAILAASSVRAGRSSRAGQLLLIHRLRLLNPFPFVDPPRQLDAYDFDDDLFEGYAASVNRRFQWAKQEARRAVACVSRARLVLAGNRFLADQALRFNSRIEVIPSCVDPTHQSTRQHADTDIVTIGWIGSETTSAYLRPILPVLERVNRNRLRARLVTIGGTLNHTAAWLEQKPWSLASEADELARFDIGVMPLPDTQWARGKCGYKLLQYFAAGVPAVASPVGISSNLVGTDRGLLAGTADDWERSLDRLIRDPQERAERGARARSFVEREYSYQRWAPRLAELLHSLE